MENTCLILALNFGLFCHASEKVTNKPDGQVKSLMDEYHNSFKPQLETEIKMNNSLAKDVVSNNKQERKFGRGSSGPGEAKL